MTKETNERSSLDDPTPAQWDAASQAARDGADRIAAPVALRFPAMVRKMWSGGEVQKWLDEQGPLYARPAWWDGRTVAAAVHAEAIEDLERIDAALGLDPNEATVDETLAAIAALRAEQLALAYPAELTPALREVLGLMLWTTTPIAHALRSGGAEIRPKAEEEQAHVLHWLIQLALRHDEAWRSRAVAKLNEIKAGTATAQ